MFVKTFNDPAVAVGHSVNPADWQITFDELVARIAGRFGRIEPRRTARACLSAPLSNIERKNCWYLAEQAGHAGPHAMQRLLRTARWQVDEVRDDLREYVIEHLGHDSGVLIVDETGFVKKGSGGAGCQETRTMVLPYRGLRRSAMTAGTSSKSRTLPTGVAMTFCSASSQRRP